MRRITGGVGEGLQVMLRKNYWWSRRWITGRVGEGFIDEVGEGLLEK